MGLGTVLRQADDITVTLGATGTTDTLTALLAAMGDDAVHLTVDFSGADSDGVAETFWHDALMVRRKQIKSLTVVDASSAVRVSSMALAGVMGIILTLRSSAAAPNA
jgi:hypothetical protein